MVSYRATLSHISRDMWKCGIQSHNQQNINTRRYSYTQFTIAIATIKNYVLGFENSNLTFKISFACITFFVLWDVTKKGEEVSKFWCVDLKSRLFLA